MAPSAEARKDDGGAAEEEEPELLVRGASACMPAKEEGADPAADDVNDDDDEAEAATTELLAPLRLATPRLSTWVWSLLRPTPIPDSVLKLVPKFEEEVAPAAAADEDDAEEAETEGPKVIPMRLLVSSVRKTTRFPDATAANPPAAAEEEEEAAAVPTGMEGKEEGPRLKVLPKFMPAKLVGPPARLTPPPPPPPPPVREPSSESERAMKGAKVAAAEAPEAADTSVADLVGSGKFDDDAAALMLPPIMLLEREAKRCEKEVGPAPTVAEPVPPPPPAAEEA